MDKCPVKFKATKAFSAGTGNFVTVDFNGKRRYSFLTRDEKVCLFKTVGNSYGITIRFKGSGRATGIVWLN